MKYLLAITIALVMVCSVFGQSTGSYSPVAVTDPAVVAAAKFAVDAKETEKKIDIGLDAIMTAEQQVVAGTNYRLCLSLTMPPRDEGDDFKRSFVVVVYRDLKAKLSLTTWIEADDCSKKAVNKALFADRVNKTSDDLDYFAKTAETKPAISLPPAGSNEAVDEFIESGDESDVKEAEKEIAAGHATHAVEILDKLIARRPEMASAYFQRSSANFNLGRIQQSLDDVNRAIKLKPTDGKAFMMRGSIAASKNDLDAAVGDFSRAIELDPKLSTAFYDRGTIYIKQSKWQAAIADLTRSIEMDPTDANAHLNRGIAYGYAGNFDAKIEDLQVANEIDQSNTVAATMIVDNIRALTPKEFEAFANPRLDKLNNINARIRPEEDKFAALFAAKDGPGICQQLKIMQPLRAERMNVLSRAVLLELRGDLEHFKPIIEGLKTIDDSIEADEKALTAIGGQFKCQ